MLSNFDYPEANILEVTMKVDIADLCSPDDLLTAALYLKGRFLVRTQMRLSEMPTEIRQTIQKALYEKDKIC
jgi:hypothetical protein